MSAKVGSRITWNAGKNSGVLEEMDGHGIGIAVDDSGHRWKMQYFGDSWMPLSSRPVE